MEMHRKSSHGHKNKEQQPELGPGYMGWKMPDIQQEHIDENGKLKTLEDKIVELENEKKETRKEIRELKKEINGLKDDYKQCMEALKKETYDKNKAEIMCNVLKETIETEKELKRQNGHVISETEPEQSELDMSIDEQETWKEQKKTRNRKRKQISIVGQQCEDCKSTYQTKNELLIHIEKSHARKNSINCQKCKYECETAENLKEHMKNVHSNVESYKCDLSEKQLQTESVSKSHSKTVHNDKDTKINCEQYSSSFQTENEVKDHTKVHSKDEVEKQFVCQKCSKAYPTMSKLRRHDWRSHREIQCNRCGENVSSRQELKTHRENVHEMVNKVYCRYYPNCMDEEECLYAHEQIEDSSVNGCVDGSDCRDQSCKFSDKEHKDNRILCKFQTNCNRLNCIYKHVVARKAFLGPGLSKENKK